MKTKIIIGASVLSALIMTGCSTSSSNYLLDNTPKVQTPSPNNIQPATQFDLSPTYTESSLPRYIEPSPEKKERFTSDFRTVAIKTKSDPAYERMGLDTPETKRWFKQTTYLLWNRDISRSQYIKEGLTRFPSSRYEFNFVANNLTSDNVIND